MPRKTQHTTSPTKRTGSQTGSATAAGRKRVLLASIATRSIAPALLPVSDGPLSSAPHADPATPLPDNETLASASQRINKHTYIHAAGLYLNDQALWRIITRDREDSLGGRIPSEYYDSGVSALLTSNPTSARHARAVSQALLLLRGKALGLSRATLGAYCGISDMTIYRQETTHWEVSGAKPCWYYWLTVWKWGNQCWGHMPNYRMQLGLVRRWCEWHEYPHAVYLEHRDAWLNQ